MNIKKFIEQHNPSEDNLNCEFYRKLHRLTPNMVKDIKESFDWNIRQLYISSVREMSVDSQKLSDLANLVYTVPSSGTYTITGTLCLDEED